LNFKSDIINKYTINGYPLWKHNLNYNILDINNDISYDKIIKNSFINPITYFSVIQGYLNIDIDFVINTCLLYL
jgi:hypothetical protein